MKKVRYALGVVGLAPAAGLLMPATGAAAPVAHTPKTAGKAVSLQHVHGTARPGLTCGATHTSSTHSRNGHLREIILYSLFGGSPCISSVAGLLNKNQRSLEMRTRVYEYPGGPRVFQGYVHGSAFLTTTSFQQPVNKLGQQACIALVSSHHLSRVLYGPICLSP